jgi:deoxyribonuclease-4
MNGGYKVGFHVSIAGGISNSVDNAKSMGCSAFQIFSRNPRGWTAKPLDAGDVATFKQKLAASGIDRDSIAVHMPYLPNLSGPPGENYAKSVATLTGELERSGELGIPFLVLHLGSHKDKGVPAGTDQLVNAISTARDKAKKHGQSVMILLENNAGQKNNVGGNFQELRTILDRLGVDAGICMDTCHAFASGYDIRTAEGVEKTLTEFDSAVGFKELRLVHLNDSKGELNSNLDRHDHIGLGYIGKVGLFAFVRHKAIRKLPIIMETPIDQRRDDAGNLKAFLELIT